MPKITNNTKRSLNFVTGVKDGVAVTDDVSAGETKTIETDVSSAQFKGLVHAGAISVDKRTADKVAKSAGEASSPSA